MPVAFVASKNTCICIILPIPSYHGYRILLKFTTAQKSTLISQRKKWKKSIVEKTHDNISNLFVTSFVNNIYL